MARVRRFVATDDDGDAIGEEVQSTRQTRRLGRHRVGLAVVHDRAARSDQHREPQRELLRIDLERPQPLALLGQQHRRRLPPGVRLRGVVLLAQPDRQLPGGVRLVDEGRVLEEGQLQPVAEVGPRAAIRAAPRTHLDPQADLQRRVGKRRIPFQHATILVRADADGARPIERRQQRNAAERSVVGHQRPHAGLETLIGDDRRNREARVLEPRDEEGHRTLGAVAELEIDLAEAVAGDLARHLVVLAERPAATRADAGDQRIEGALPAFVTGVTGAPDNLQRSQIRLLEQQIDHKGAKWLRF